MYNVQIPYGLANVLHMNGNAITVSALTMSSSATDSPTAPIIPMKFAVALKVK